MLSINQQIYEAGGLSAKAQIVLGWLPELQTWVNKLASASEDIYSFVSEAELLNQILYGLYSTSTFHLKTCDIWASPERYLELAEQDLSVIDAVESGAKDKATLSRYKKLISNEDIIPDKQLEPVSAFLKMLYAEQVVDYPFLSHDSRISLLGLAEHVNAVQYGDEQIMAARTFIQNTAIDQSAIPGIAEFAFAVLDNIRRSKQDNSDPMSADSIVSLMDKHYAELLNVAMGYLSCPTMQLPFQHTQIGKTINNWGMNAEVIGFTNLPTAIAQIADQVLVESATQESLSVRLDGFRNSLVKFMSQCKITKHTMSQDAADWYYDAESSQYTGVFVLGEDGVLCLDSINRKSSKEEDNDK